MLLRAGYLALAHRLQESADSLSSNDVRTRLSDAIQDAHRDTGKWAYYYIDHFGDAESGDVIYSCDGDTFRAPYSITSTGGAAKCAIDMEAAADVVPRTVYEEEQDEDDHYAAMEEAYKRDGLYTALPLYERFVAKKERDEADKGDFAGKGKSFPILKPEDVMAAVHAMGRAGSGNHSMATLKAHIIAIAKRKGWTKQLPKGWQDGGGDSSERKEAIRAVVSEQHTGQLVLVESAATVEPILLRESARSEYEIKLISPGKGATAFYPPEVLKRDGADAFPANTKVYLNHEEGGKDSGGNRDAKRFIGVLARPAEWKESHAKGPGLFSTMRLFSDAAEFLNERAPYLDMSINAMGQQAVEAGKRVVREGLPVVGALRRTLDTSVDVVPAGGAGGLILAEAARAANSNEGGADDMDAAELTKLQESIAAQAALNARLLKRAIAGDARALATDVLRGITLHEAGKSLVVDTVLRDIPEKDGDLDREKFAEAVKAEATRVGAAFGAATGSGRVTGMGVAAPVAIDAKEAERRTAESKRLREAAVQAYMQMGLPKAAAEAAAGKEEAA